MNFPLNRFKKAGIILALAAFVASCGGSSENKGNTEEKENAAKTEGAATPAETKIDPSSNPDYAAGFALVQKSDCLSCHKENEKLIGPSYKDVANKYPMGDATVDMLAKKIIAGGQGVWGEVPMTPHPQISTEDAKKMVKYIMLLKS